MKQNKQENILNVWNKNWVILWTSGLEKDDIGNNESRQKNVFAETHNSEIYLYLIFFVEFIIYDTLKGVTVLFTRQKNRFIFFRIWSRKMFYPNMQYYRLLFVNKSSQVVNAREKNVIKTKIHFNFLSLLLEK